MTILNTLAENAIRYPDRKMMVSCYRSNKQELTWSELHEYSDYVASWMDEHLHTKTPVVVYGHKNPLMIVCFIACVKSGRAYCPIDVNVPLARVEAIIGEVHPELILCTEKLDIESPNIVELFDKSGLSRFGKKRISEEKYVSSEDVFYIIFTSGSTGTPKGVQITRDCLDNFISWASALGSGIDEDKHYTFLNQAPFSFDLSVMDLYLCLYSGGTLWALSKELQSDIKSLYNSLGESNVNKWISTPSFADVCLTDPMFSSNLMPELTDFLFCGEILTNKTVKRLHSRFSDSYVVNTYGPTESTCAVTDVIISSEINEKYSPLPVGRPKKGTWIRITDENGNELPDGEKGEIVIVGDSVSVGYWKNAERNELVFGTTTVQGEKYRFYKTGDEGYLIENMLFYSGRIDNQVKLHGYRIELEDIENNLLKIPGILQAVVLPRYRDGKVSSLVAIVVSQDDKFNEDDSDALIKQELKKNLPEYMIPKKILFAKDLPRTNNGKIDRKKLGGTI